MRILSYHFGHDGSITFLRKGRIVYHSQLERFNKFKSNAVPSRELINVLKTNNIQADIFILSWVFENNWCKTIVDLFKRNNIITDNCKVVRLGITKHHIFHALCAFHTTRLKKANIYVFDGHGAAFYNKDNVLLEECVSGYKIDDQIYEMFKLYYGSKDEDTYDNNDSECGVAYAKLTHSLGFKYNEDGKTMAFASYGKPNKNIPSFLNENYVFKRPFFNGSNGYVPIQNLKNKLTINKDDEYSKDVAWRIQKDFEEKTLFDIKQFIKKAPCKDLIITGGCAQNIFANTRLVDELDVNVHVDPMCNDQGLSMGAAIMCWLEVQNSKVNRVEDVFLGFPPEYNLDIFKNYKIEDTDENKVADLLINKEVVAIYSGRSEQGQRGLGNRSLLADATVEDARERVSAIKKRAWYRPFACSILKEDFEEWFETNKLKESPYMLYVFKMKKPIKSVVGPDNMSRPQTVSSDISPYYYKLIEAFKAKTNIPLVLNTSLNLPNESLVETMEDLKITMDNSQLKYAYLPDIKKLITKQF